MDGKSNADSSQEISQIADAGRDLEADGESEAMVTTDAQELLRLQSTGAGSQKIAKRGKLKNDLHERFCQEYLIDCHGRKAAIRAGYKRSNADYAAWELKQRRDVKERLAFLQAAVFSDVLIDARLILQELINTGFSNIGDYLEFGPNGVKLRNSEELGDNQLAAISEVSEKPGKFGSALTVKLHDKIASLRLLGQHLALFTERVEHGLSESLAQQVARMHEQGELQQVGADDIGD